MLQSAMTHSFHFTVTALSQAISTVELKSRDERSGEYPAGFICVITEGLW